MRQFRSLALVTLASVAIFAFQVTASSAEMSGPIYNDSGHFRHETITVYAPYVVKRRVINPMMSKDSTTGLELVSVSQAVSFADLDLSDADQVKILERRVRQAASSACGEIDKRFPRTQYIPIPENQDCVGNALGAAMISVKALEVAAARY